MISLLAGKFSSQSLARDFTASIVVFLVAMPLCMGIAIASGVPPEKGLVTGIIGGLVVGLFAGSPLQVSGPAAGLAVLVFEFVTDRLGAQGTVIAGGRYDGLIEALGGPHTPAVGWAAGIERLAMMLDAAPPERPSVVIVPLGPRAELKAQAILVGLRAEGVAADMGYRGNMKKRLGRANEAGAAYALIIGDEELDRGEAQLKNLSTGEQRGVSLDLIAEAIAR